MAGCQVNGIVFLCRQDKDILKNCCDGFVVKNRCIRGGGGDTCLRSCFTVKAQIDQEVLKMDNFFLQFCPDADISKIC